MLNKISRAILRHDWQPDEYRQGCIVAAGKLPLGTPIAAVSGAATTPLRNNTYDVDFWQFTVQYDATQQIAGASTIGPHVPVTIDLDFADSFSGGCNGLTVYDSQNRLILIGRDSNISDDQPKPANGSDTTIYHVVRQE